MQHYTFESSNLGEVTFFVDGRYKDGRVNAADFTVSIEGTGQTEEFDEVPYGSADEMFEWLSGQGVEFASPRSLLFNLGVVEDVMIERCSTVDKELDYCASLTDEDVRLLVSVLPIDPTFKDERSGSVKAEAEGLDALCSDAIGASSAKGCADGPDAERQQEDQR